VTGPLLDVRHLSVEVAGRRVLHDVSIAVDVGGSLGIVGETGSGKSMTCRAALGLLGRIGGAVVAGTATFAGRELTALSRDGWRAIRGRQIGFVPQTSMSSLDPVMRIGRQIEETVRVLDPGADARARSLELLEAVELPRADRIVRRHPHELSGGMRQRVMIALALAGRPRLLIADEVTTALDVTVQRTILELLGNLRRQLDMALVLVTHDLAVVESSCETMAVLYAGATVEAGPAGTLCTAPSHPYTRALIAAQPLLTDGGPLASIPGAPPEAGTPHDGCAFAPRCSHADGLCLGGTLALEPVSAGHVVACRRVREVVR